MAAVVEADRASLVVAVDGPSGSGKSTVSRAVASAMQLRYLDTGAMYRALTWWVLHEGVDPTDTSVIADMAERIDLDISTDSSDSWVRVGSDLVASSIRLPDVTAAVSVVSAVPRVRTQMVARQRRIIGGGGIVVEGRDIGTTVCPNAAVKIFLTASVETRANRRARELELTSGIDVAATGVALARRDGLDSSRTASPLARAADAVELDTTSLDLEQVIDAVLVIVGARTGLHPSTGGPHE